MEKFQIDRVSALAGRIPDFLIIGAAKSGTTSLYRYLAGHPQVFMSSHKEPHFFSYYNRRPVYNGPGDEWLNKSAVTDFDEYRELFQPARKDQLVGEASAMYMYLEGTAERIVQIAPEARLVAVLRNPIDRAFSAYNHLRRDGREPEQSFAEALDREDDRVAGGWGPIWHYRRMGFYAKQLDAYQQFLDSGQLLVVLYDELRANPDVLLTRIAQYLNLDGTIDRESRTRYNQSGVPRSRWLHDRLRRGSAVGRFLKPLLPEHMRRRVVATLHSYNLRPVLSIEQADRDRLRETYADEIRDLGDLLERDLSEWLR